MNYLNINKEMVLTLSADNTNIIKWYDGAAFSVHPDLKIHTGTTMAMGQVAVTSISKKKILI